MIKVTLSNKILKYISEIEKNTYKVSSIKLPTSLVNALRKNSKKKSSYASNKIEGNPLSESQVDEVIESDKRRHLLKPQQEVRNYYLALNYLETKAKKKEPITKNFILDIQKLIEKGATKEKIGYRLPMPPGVLFAVYDSKTGNPDYIPPEAKEVSNLVDDLVEYINTSDDHPLILAAVTHYQLVTIHPFEDGNGRTARLLSGYILAVNGYEFKGIGSLEEYFAYDADEYYKSIQMGLPALYYSGRNNPPHPEIWIEYFLKMVLLYSSKICELETITVSEQVDSSLSHLRAKECELLLFLVKNYHREFSPKEISLKLKVSNKTVINRLSTLSKNGFVEPILAPKRIRFYKLTKFSIYNKTEIIKKLK